MNLTQRVKGIITTKLTLLLLTLLALCLLAAAQSGYTTVTATVVDSTGAPYVNAPYTVSFFDPGTSGKLPLLNGSTFQKSYTGVNTDSFGNLNVVIADNGAIAATSGATETEWTFSISDQTNKCHAQFTIAVTGSGVNLSSTFTSNVPILSTCQGVGPGTGTIKVNGVPVVNANLQTSSTVSYSVLGSNIQLIASPFSVNGTPIPGGNFQNSATVTFSISGSNISATALGNVNLLPLNNFWTGGLNTFNGVSATSFVDTSLTLNTSPLCTNGTGGAFTNIGCSGGGGSTPPAGTSGTIQSTDGAGNFTTSHANDNIQIPGAYTINNQFATCAANPWIDITCFGARALTSQVTNNTASCNGTTTITTTGGPLALFNGDGVVIYNCGATNVLATPSAPTITPSIMSGPDKNADQVAGTTGSTTVSYSIVARDANGGLTAASPVNCNPVPGPLVGCILTGLAALGAQSSTNSTLTRANNIVTVTTTAANGAAVGGEVYETGSSDASFSGMFLIASVISTTQFTYTQGSDSRAPIPTGNINNSNGYSTNSATGGTSKIYNVNHLSWTPVSGAYQYYVCVGSSLIGVTRPGETVWNDHGPTESARGTLPDFVPSSCPSVATNDYLSTTIISGGGTNSLIVANTASQTASAQTIKQNSGPAILAAFNSAVANGKSAIRIPSTGVGQTFFVNSNTALSGAIALQVLQSGSLTLNETLDTIGVTDGIKWSGPNGGSGSTMPQFGFTPAQALLTNAYPGIYFTSPAAIRNVAVTYPAQGLGFDIGGTQLFNSSVEDSSFASVTSSADYMGEAIVLNGNANVTFKRVTSITNDSLPNGYSLTPTILMKTEVGNANAAGKFYCDHCYFAGRGFGENGNASIFANTGTIEFDSPYMQAGKNPTIHIGKFSFMTVRINNGLQDTTPMPILTMLSAEPVTITNTPNTGGESPGGSPGLISGVPIPGLFAINDGTSLGQNRDFPIYTLGAEMQIPTFSPGGSVLTGDLQFNAPTHFPAPYTLYWDAPPPPIVTATGPASATSTLAIGSWTSRIQYIGVDGGASKFSPQSSNACVVTTTNQTCTYTYPAVTGATGYIVWSENGVSGWGRVAGCNNIQVLTCTQSAPQVGGVVPTDTGTGTTSLSGTGIQTPQMRQNAVGQWATTGTMTGGTFTFTFPVAYVNAPVCTASDVSAPNAVQVVTSTTTAILNGTSGDSASVICVGNPD